ncbi:MAG: hypothetical protein AB7Q69_02435 [Gemmatimonadales bacterium]
MLTLDQVRAQRRRRPPPSLKQQYQEYVLQRIESFKNSIPRAELLRLGDEAVAELQATTEGQFILTEVLMLDCVDRLITRRLGLQSYRRWRQHFLKLRAAQQEPNHWGLDSSSAVTALLPRIEAGDHVLAVGAATEPAAYLMASHDAAVTFVGADLGTVERVEQRVAAESLGAQFLAWVAHLGHWFPELEAQANAVIIDAAALVDIDPPDRHRLMSRLQDATTPMGVHIVVPGSPKLAPEALLPFYAGWTREHPERRRSTNRTGLVLGKPPCQTDTDENASDRHGGRASG